MRTQWHSALLAVASMAAVTAGAHAQQGPRGGVGQASAGGFYVWVDGSFQSINLPTYGVGLVRADFPGFTAIGPLDPSNVRASGAGIDAAIGYTFRNGTFSPAWGSNVRLELGGSHIDADARQSASAAFGAPTPEAVVVQMLNGFTAVGFGCSAGSCAYATNLSTDYAATRFNARGTSDFRLSAVTVSPSLEVFTGHARNDQSFAGFVKQSHNSVPNKVYQADTSLAWSDWGARVGLNGKLDVTPWLAFGLGGNIGFANRDVDLSGGDTTFGTTTTIARSTDSTAFLANLEASLTARSSSQLEIRAFAGLNFDSRVPGIAPATFVGPCCSPLQTTPAGIAFSSETSYYTGIGITLSFGP